MALVATEIKIGTETITLEDGSTKEVPQVRKVEVSKDFGNNLKEMKVLFDEVTIYKAALITLKQLVRNVITKNSDKSDAEIQTIVDGAVLKIGDKVKKTQADKVAAQLEKLSPEEKAEFFKKYGVKLK